MDTKLKNNKLMMLSLIFIVFSLIIIPVSRAAQVTFVVEGYLEYVGDELAGTFSLGDLYHLEYTFDSTTLDSIPDDPDHGGYNNSISSLWVKIGDYSAVADSSGRNHIDVINDHPVDADLYRVALLDPMIGESINGYNPANFQAPLLSLIDLSMNAFSSDELFTYALDHSNSIGCIALTFYNPNVNPVFQSTGIQANISSFEVSSIPIPSSFLLFFSGLFGLLGANKFRKD